MDVDTHHQIEEENKVSPADVTLNSDSSNEDVEMNSEEQRDQCSLYTEDNNTFRQVDYLWLFDPVLKFSERKGMSLNDANLDTKDFLAMRQVNRMQLTKFFIDVENHGISKAAALFSAEYDEQESEEDEAWSDEILDEEIKQVLSSYEHGRYLDVDLTAHLEYFYNTLDCGFKTRNPFKKSQYFPALQYRASQDFDLVSGTSSPALLQRQVNPNIAVDNLSPEKQDSQNVSMADCTLFEKHRLVIFPQSASRQTQCETTGQTHSDTENTASNFKNNSICSTSSTKLLKVKTISMLPQKYKWYPNMNIQSPLKQLVSVSPAPKKISYSSSRASIKIDRNPFARVSGQFDPQMLNNVVNNARKPLASCAINPAEHHARLNPNVTGNDVRKTQRRFTIMNSIPCFDAQTTEAAGSIQPRSSLHLESDFDPSHVFGLE